MVYEGKPSQGCGTCRKRRIRCDQVRPICGQCIKSKRECLGYRDQAGLMFVSANESLEAKAAGKKPQRGRSSREWESPESEAPSGSSVSVPNALPETAERQALAFFFSEFALPPRHREPARSFVEHILPVYTEAHRESPIFDATAAAAHAALSNHRRSQSLMMHSRHHYGKAVMTLQEAIADPARARKNETLMSIMVLGLFEAVTSSNQSVFKWGHHADGAMALVKWRGAEEMLAEPLGRKLYWSVIAQAISYHIIKDEAMEPYLDWENLWQEPVDQLKHPPGIKLTIIGSRIPALRAAAAEWFKLPMSGTVAMKCVDIIGNAKIIDQACAGWAFEIPSGWRPRVVTKVEGNLEDPLTSFLYPGELYSYNELWVGSLWNSWRSQRIICNSLILNGLERLLPPEKIYECPEYRSAVGIIQSMADGVCASVPYHLGYPMPEYDDLAHKHNPKFDSQCLDDADQPLHRAPTPPGPGTIKTLGAFYLLVPLVLSNSAFSLCISQRNWMRGRLLYVANRLQSNQAQKLADMSPVAIEGTRTASITDFLPPSYGPYPDVYELVQSHDFRRLESIKELQATTAEALRLQMWRSEFVERILDIDLTAIAHEFTEAHYTTKRTLQERRRLSISRNEYSTYPAEYMEH